MRVRLVSGHSRPTNMIQTKEPCIIDYDLVILTARTALQTTNNIQQTNTNNRTQKQIKKNPIKQREK